MRNKKLEKNTRQRKIITHTKQYLHGSTISLCPRSCRDFTIIREKYKVRQCRFFLSQKLQRQTLITKNNVFYILHTGFTMGYKTSQKFFPGALPSNPPRGLSMSAKTWACWPKPQLHGLSLRKSPIKNHAILFRVGSGRQPDQT